MATKNTVITERGINAIFMMRFREAQTLWRLLCSEFASTAKLEKHGWLGALPMVREWIGERQAKALEDYALTLENIHWEMTLEIDRDEARDAQNSALRSKIASAARRFAQHPDALLMELINAGESTVCYDGQNFFDTDHVEGDSGTQSNLLSFDAATPTAPTKAEFEAALWQAIKAMAGFKDDQGEPWNQFQGLEDMEGVVAFVPVPFMDVASKVMGDHAQLTIDADTNVMAGRGKVIVTPRYAQTDAFDLFKVDEDSRPFLFQTRQDIETEYEDTKKSPKILHMLDARYNVGPLFWQKAVRTRFV